MVDREKDIEAARAVQAWLAGQTFGNLRPTQVELRREEDASGQEAWFFVVSLPNPDPDVGTWPVDTLNQVARETRDKAISLGVTWPWYTVFFPESEEDQEDEDQLQLPGA